MTDENRNIIEQIKENISIIEYAKSMGFTVKKVGSSYTLKEHDSVRIHESKNRFVQNSTGIKGSIIDFVMQFESIDKNTALNKLSEMLGTNKFITTRKTIQKEDTVAQFIMPPPTTSKYSRAFAYLNKTRKIDSNIISNLMHDKKIYQDDKNNVVFVGFDENKKPTYASVRSTATGVNFKGDVKGSQKKYGFDISFKDNVQLYVFESPIDALSHATIVNIHLDDKNAYKLHNRLSLGGLDDKALETYLKNNSQIKIIGFCLDNDKNSSKNHGQDAAKVFKSKYEEKGYIVKCFCPKNKDFNEDLINIYSLKKTANIAQGVKLKI